MVRLMSFSSLSVALFAAFMFNGNSYTLISYFIALEIIMYMVIFSLSWFHLMILMMILELLMLKVFFISVSVLNMSSSPMFIFTFVTLSVAEASVALSLLTMLIRSHGEDLLFLSNL